MSLHRAKRIFFPTAAFAFMMAGTSMVYAQQTVQGAVTDPLGAAVTGAKVSLQHEGASAADTTTNDKGAFTFSGVAEGRYRLEVDKDGFARYLGPEVFVASSGATTLDATLQLSEISQGVSVTATGSETPIAQIGSSVSVIDEVSPFCPAL